MFKQSYFCVNPALKTLATAGVFLLGQQQLVIALSPGEVEVKSDKL